jgi:uncharacterized repeat protein (TIGR01451 family)
METRSRVLNAALLWVLVLAFTAMPTRALADQDPPEALRIVAVNLTAQAEGRTPPEGSDTPESRPGDRIEYRISFTNVTDGPVRDVVFDDPIPQGLVFVLGSAGAGRADVVVEFSIDGGATYTPNPEVEIRREGQTVRVPAPAERYTHVRWRVQEAVAPGEEIQARFQAVIAGTTSQNGKPTTPAPAGA